MRLNCSTLPLLRSSDNNHLIPWRTTASFAVYDTGKCENVQLIWLLPMLNPSHSFSVTMLSWIVKYSQLVRAIKPYKCVTYVHASFASDTTVQTQRHEKRASSETTSCGHKLKKLVNLSLNFDNVCLGTAHDLVSMHIFSSCLSPELRFKTTAFRLISISICPSPDG